MNKKMIGILLITILAIVTITSLSYYILSQSNQTSNNPSPTPTPTSTPTPSPSAQTTEPSSIPKPSIPEFTVKLVAHPYDVPPTTNTEIDQYTGEETVITTPGYHVENKSIEIIIKNQPFTRSDADKDNLFYNVRVKGHYGQDSDWRELYYPFTYVIQDSESEYTTISFALNDPHGTSVGTSSMRLEFPPDAEVDFQVEAMIGYSYEGVAIMRYSTFIGEKSGWSNTQTIKIP